MREAGFWRSLRRVKAGEGRRPDFDRFRRAITRTDTGPVPVSDTYTDAEGMGALLRELVRNLTLGEV